MKKLVYGQNVKILQDLEKIQASHEERTGSFNIEALVYSPQELHDRLEDNLKLNKDIKTLQTKLKVEKNKKVNLSKPDEALQSRINKC